MSAKWFTVLIGSLLALLIAFAITLTTVSVVKYDLVFRDICGEASGGGSTAVTPDNIDATYYKRDYTDSDELNRAEQAYTRKAGAEGFVLLENSGAEGKGLPVAPKSKLSLFSASSVDLLAGGTGSGVSTISSDMKTALTEQGFTINEALWKFYTDNHKTYTRANKRHYKRRHYFEHYRHTLLAFRVIPHVINQVYTGIACYFCRLYRSYSF